MNCEKRNGAEEREKEQSSRIDRASAAVPRAGCEDHGKFGDQRYDTSIVNGETFFELDLLKQPRTCE